VHRSLEIVILFFSNLVALHHLSLTISAPLPVSTTSECDISLRLETVTNIPPLSHNTLFYFQSPLPLSKPRCTTKHQNTNPSIHVINAIANPLKKSSHQNHRFHHFHHIYRTKPVLYLAINASTQIDGAALIGIVSCSSSSTQHPISTLLPSVL